MPLRPLLVALLLLGVIPAGALAAPRILVAPGVTGEPRIGTTLQAQGTVVEGAVADDVTLQWERARAGEAFVPLEEAYGTAYLLEGADRDATLRVCATVETPAGADRACSSGVGPVVDPNADPTTRARLRIGAVYGLERISYPYGDGEVRVGVRRGRWAVQAGEAVAVEIALHGARPDRAVLRVVPTVDAERVGSDEVEAIVGEDGILRARFRARVNAVVWLDLSGEAQPVPVAIRLGVLGVRPRIELRLGAVADGRDARGQALVRDLRILPGSRVAPGVAGMRLRWEGILPGQRSGTAVCRTDETARTGPTGALRGRCATRGAWATARWRLVYDPGVDDPGATAWLPATSAWVRPRTV